MFRYTDPAEIIQRVVHPAHVPLNEIPAPPDKGAVSLAARRWIPRQSSSRPGIRVGDVVESPQEFDGLEVLPSPILVGDPLAGLA